MEHFLATGNLISRSNLDMQQTAGFTVVADKLNMVRFLSHFRSIHRGQYFTEMKTTTVRKLLPEQWGFVCPVHTPDGSPCGLLNHISLSCVPLANEDLNMQKESHKLRQLLCMIGMNPVASDFGLVHPHDYLPVVLDGKLLGSVDPKMAANLVQSLRLIKIQQQYPNKSVSDCVPRSLEIAFLPAEAVNNAGRAETFKEKFFPGIFLSSATARFVRPVKNLEHGGIELIGPLE